MTIVNITNRSLTINPLKQSSPLGAALCLLGLKGIVPLFHGSQGCTAFTKVFLVKHFREAIPLATTAMTEVSTILGSEENIEQAILTLVKENNPEIIGLFTTGLTETRGDDMIGILKTIYQRYSEIKDLPIIFVSTPDYKGSLQDGFALSVESIVSTDFNNNKNFFIKSSYKQINVLCGSLLSPGDIKELKDIFHSFNLNPIFVPDISESLDGHLEDKFNNTTTSSGTSLLKLKLLKKSIFTIAIGESMRFSAKLLQKNFGIDYIVFPSLLGLAEVDQFFVILAQIASYKQCTYKFFQSYNYNWSLKSLISSKYKRQRSQLQDTILDSHFYLSNKKISLGLEPDLLYQISCFLKNIGIIINGLVTTTNSFILKNLPFKDVIIGDLKNLEELSSDSDFIISNSQAKYISNKLKIPIYCIGYPINDKLGNGTYFIIGYQGTMNFLFDIANIFISIKD